MVSRMLDSPQVRPTGFCFCCFFFFWPTIEQEEFEVIIRYMRMHKYCCFLLRFSHFILKIKTYHPLDCEKLLVPFKSSETVLRVSSCSTCSTSEQIFRHPYPSLLISPSGQLNICKFSCFPLLCILTTSSNLTKSSGYFSWYLAKVITRLYWVLQLHLMLMSLGWTDHLENKVSCLQASSSHASRYGEEMELRHRWRWGEKSSELQRKESNGTGIKNFLADIFIYE